MPTNNSPASGRHRSANAQTRRRRTSAAAAGIGVLVASVVALTHGAGATGTPTPIVHDSMARTVSSGFGAADLGGAYSVSSTATTHVAEGLATMKPINAGSAITAVLPARAQDTGVQVTYRNVTVSPGGLGTYLDVLLRRSANGSAYLAKVRFDPSGYVALSVSRLSGGETFLSREVTIARSVPAGSAVTLWAEVSGTSPVTIHASAAVGSTRPASWQLSATDKSSGRITAAGSIGLLGYNSRGSAGPVSTGISALDAWDGSIPTSAATTTPPPTKAAPTSSAPSSSVPPSSSPAPTSSSASRPSSSSSNPTTPAPSPTNSTPAPVPSDNAGAAPLGTTNYPIPSGSLFVSPSGDDTAAGTSSAPLRTVAHAIAVAKAGSTVVLRAGTYHESVTVQAGKPLTIQAYPGDVVWFDGSSAVSGWTARGATWVHTGWTAQFDSTPSYTPGSIPSGPAWSFVSPSYPMASHPDQAWIDGTALRQVATAGEVGPGTFAVDYATGELIVGSDPSGHAVRASDLAVAFTSYAANTTLRGVGVQRYATPIAQIGTVRMVATANTVENVISQNNATTGLTVDAADNTVRHVTLTGNGMLGMHASTADQLTVTDVLATSNNTEHFNQAPVSGGIKIGRSRGITITDSTISNNLGYGLWLDESCYAMTIVGNSIDANTAHGLALEISSHAIVADNTITNNGQDGMKINNTDHAEIWNNTLLGNARQIDLVQDTRRGSDLSVPGHDPRQKQPDPSEPWTLTDDQFVNNLLGQPASGNIEVNVRDYSGQYSGSQLGLTIEGNVFAKMAAGTAIVWQSTTTTTAAYPSVAQFSTATGLGRSNIDASSSGTPSAPTVSGASPQPLPADVAAAVGQPAGTRHIGTF